MKISRLLSCLLALPLAATAQQVVPKVHNPLDGLTAEEYWAVHDILHKSGHMTADTLVSTLLLHEPNKAAVLGWKPGQPIKREADVILIEKDQTIESLVDISTGKVETWNVIPGVQAPFTPTELHSFDALIKSDPRTLAAFKKRGITDLSTVHCGAGPLALRVYAEQDKNMRIGYGGCSDNHGQFHHWGHSIDGLAFKVDVPNHKLLDVIDRGNVPVALQYDGRFEYTEGILTPDTKPIVVSQPQGTSWTIKDGEVSWQNWRFRFRLDSRVGPVVNLLKYMDGDKLRSVMYQGNFSEMYVPYMSPKEGWNSRSYLDAGEFPGLGGILKPVADDDCPTNSGYFPVLYPNDDGTPSYREQGACLFERSATGPAWHHYENNIMAARPARELVLRTAASIGNYDYLMDWIFQQDGTIRVAVGATGIVETMGVEESVAKHDMGGLHHGTLVAPQTEAVNHDHYFSYRLDMDVDGTANNFMVDHIVPEDLHEEGVARKQIWAVKPEMVKTEKEAIRDLDNHHPAMWAFTSEKLNKWGNPTSYEIMPSATEVSSLSLDDPAQRVGAFATHQFWVTPYKPDEKYAAGVYVTNSAGLEGLPKWTLQNRNIQNTDIVAWYTLGFHHIVRSEDWPVMPTLWHEFMIRPANFFDENPTMNLPHAFQQ